jgi:acetyltransferase
LRKLPIRWKSPNGSHLILRQMRADDADGVKTSLNQLSPIARRYRFFTPVREFTDEMVSRLVDVDPAKEFAVVVLHSEVGQEIPVAGGRFVIDGRDCEFSLVVGDDWQGQGIGRRILKALMYEASRRGLNKIIGYVLTENLAMIELGRRMKFELLDSEEGQSVKCLARQLPKLPVGFLEKMVLRLRSRKLNI